MGRKPKNEQKDTCGQILDAAQTLFAEKGFDATGVNEIARNAGITKSVIYYHFKNKNQILETLFEQFVQFTMEGEKQYNEQRFGDSRNQDVGEMISAWFKSNREDLQKWKRMCRIVLMEAAKKNGRSDLLFRIFEENLKLSEKHYGDKLQEGAREVGGKAFFMSFFWWALPGFALFALEDEWAKRYNTNVESVREMFIECSGDLFTAIMKSNYWHI